MSDDKPHVYSESEIPAKLAEHGLSAWYLEDGWLRRKFTTDRWPGHASAGQCDRLSRRGRLAPPRPERHLGQGVGQAQDPLRRRNHRQGLCPRQEDRRCRSVAPAGRRAPRKVETPRNSSRGAHLETLLAESSGVFSRSRPQFSAAEGFTQQRQKKPHAKEDRKTESRKHESTKPRCGGTPLRRR